MISCVLAVVGCTDGGGRAESGLLRKAPRQCSTAAPFNNLSHPTPAPLTQEASVMGGHVPARIPRGFGLLQVDRLEPGHGGYVAWTDAACHRIGESYAPGVTASSLSAPLAFGRWIGPASCGDPRPCVVYQGHVNGGLITFSTWGLDPHITASLLHTVNLA